uniref:AMP-dependent synthetase/ligase domain-containing protein n=1 Tax=Bionectria ochroleuca TaxID=29856 RepID=A0A8H7NQI1_BIOOC
MLGHKLNDTLTLGFCVHSLIEHAVNKFYDKIALICANQSLTFGALNCLSNQLALSLIDQGVGRGQIVSVTIERSPRLVVALLAVLKTGAAYLPLDPVLPNQHLRHMLNDASPSCVLVDSTSKDLFTPWRSICFDLDGLRSMPTGARNPNINVQAADLAYITYSSGLTGRPKGVKHTHGDISNMLCSTMCELGCNEADRLLAITTVCSNIAVLELFLPLLCGASIVLARTPDISSPKALLGLMRQYHITTMQATPTIWQILVNQGLQEAPRLMNLICNGGKLPQKLAENLLSCADSVWNLYEPSEPEIRWSL